MSRLQTNIKWVLGGAIIGLLAGCGPDLDFEEPEPEEQLPSDDFPWVTGGDTRMGMEPPSSCTTVAEKPKVAFEESGTLLGAPAIFGLDDGRWQLLWLSYEVTAWGAVPDDATIRINTVTLDVEGGATSESVIELGELGFPESQHVLRLDDRLLVALSTIKDWSQEEAAVESTSIFEIVDGEVAVTYGAGLDVLAPRLVPLDDGRVMVVGFDPEGVVNVATLDPASSSMSEFVRLDTLGVGVPATPQLYPTRAMIAAAPVPGGILAAWVGTMGKTIRGALIDADGAVLKDVVLSSARLDEILFFAPELDHIDQNNAAMVWTATGHTDVRARLVPLDLEQVGPDDGLVVPLDRDGWQEFAGVTQLDEGRVAVIWTGDDRRQYGRVLHASGELEPVETDLDLLGACDEKPYSVRLATTEAGARAIWFEVGFEGTRIVTTLVDGL
jgi:hypothetical protein